ncbi:TcfC E-set like domain-containing protein [Sphingomicrobium nitratireducens]|uniref:TcfC E-set like domain-containing protein n=1 Tax=Sphingomicrobium nitratireducens TaxID=2964666 RepID=UPI00223FF218|nr:TcfC E-set like domain-containing protein [Sphingomicrobium nitratireducens]
MLRLFLYLFAISTVSQHAPAFAADADRVPPGFEDLDASRVVILDLMFEGRSVGNVAVEIEGQEFRFRDPAAALQTLPIESPDFNINDTFKSNAHMVCARLSNALCGILHPERIGFILDEENFRLTAFIAEQFLANRGQSSKLRPSHSSPSVTAFLSGAIAGVDDRANYLLQSDLVAAIGNIRAIAVTSMSSRENLLAREALLEVDHSSLRSKAGLFWIPTNEFVGRRRAIGLGTETQWDTTANREIDLGTELSLGLGERSRVDVFESGRLLWTGFFAAGNARIDTRSFPEGAYPVSIRISGASGRTRDEIRFFVKDRSLPSRGESKLHFFAGMLGETRMDQTTFKRPIMSAGYTKRVGNALALGGGIVATDKTALGEITAYYANEISRLRASAMVGESGQVGVSGNVSIRLTEQISFDLGAKKLWADNNLPILPTEYYGEALPRPSSSYLQPTGGYTQIVGSLNGRVGNASLRLYGNYSDTSTGKASYSIGPALDYPLLSGARGSLNFTANLLKTESSLFSFVGIRFTKSLGNSVVSGRGGLSHETFHSRDVGSDRTEFVGDVAVSSRRYLGSSTLYGAVGLAREYYGHDLRGDASVETRKLVARGSAIQNLDGVGGQTQYSATVSTALGASKDTVFVAARNTSRAGLRMEFDAPPTANFDVEVNGALVGAAKGRNGLALFVEPYRQLEVRIRPKGRAQFFVEEPVRNVTLFPGGVMRLTFSARPQVTIFGRITRQTGEPISSSLIRTTHSVSISDELGYFQIDVVEGDELLVGSETELTCKLPLMDDGYESFRKVGNLQCE